MSYRQDRDWSDKEIGQAIEIISPYLPNRTLEIAPEEMDLNEVADLVVRPIPAIRDGHKISRIALRFRGGDYAIRYPGQFTIRSWRANDAPVELLKILNGYGDWMFYGHLNETKIFWKWLLIDLSVFR